MTGITQGLSGQSTYDICIGNTYGTLDLFIKLLSDNDISSTQTLSTYKFDINANINTNNLGLYATKINNK